MATRPTKSELAAELAAMKQAEADLAAQLANAPDDPAVAAAPADDPANAAPAAPAAPEPPAAPAPAPQPPAPSREAVLAQMPRILEALETLVGRFAATGFKTFTPAEASALRLTNAPIPDGTYRLAGSQWQFTLKGGSLVSAVSRAETSLWTTQEKVVLAG